jgi:hypothetical protein
MVSTDERLPLAKGFGNLESGIGPGEDAVDIVEHPPPAQSVKTGGPESLFLSG